VDTLVLLEKGQLLLLDNENETVETTPGKTRSKFAQQPVSTKEGFRQAYQALLRQLKDAKDQIVLVPLDEFNKHGTPAYLKSMAKAVPIALLKPVIGTAEGLSKIFLGLRNTLDPTEKQDMDDKYG
jgi:autophagy-related protein 2